MFELSQDPVILPRIELPLFLSLKKLEFKEKLKEVIIALGVCLQVDFEQSLHTLEALGVLALCSVVDGVASVGFILLGEYLTHPHEQVTGVLLKERLHTDVKFLVSLHCLGIVEYCGDQVAMLDVHVFEPIPLFLTVQLVEQGLLQINTFDVQDLNKALIVSLIGKEMEHSSTSVTHIELLVDHIRRCTQVSHQIEHYVFCLLYTSDAADE